MSIQNVVVWSLIGALLGLVAVKFPLVYYLMIENRAQKVEFLIFYIIQRIFLLGLGFYAVATGQILYVKYGVLLLIVELLHLIYINIKMFGRDKFLMPTSIMYCLVSSLLFWSCVEFGIRKVWH